MTSKAKVTAVTLWGKLLSIIGYAIIIFFILGGIAAIADTNEQGTEFFIVVVVFVCIGLAFVIPGWNIKKRLKRFRTYVALISAEQVTSLDIIAIKTNQSVDFVRIDLQKMIDKKYFINAYIDKENNEIVIADMGVRNYGYTPSITNTESVQCKSCGAMNTKQMGSAAQCQYCGSSI
ncbi:MAG: hypothetical protein GYA50_07705 [Eubacteriaceae bacterium]|nr:hypothetical protein [Eubacteriaceae bacterium]